MNAKRMSVLAIAALLAVCSFVVAGVKAQGPTPHAGSTTPPQAAGKKAEEQFKNIRVLKGVPAEQIFPTMQFITASLGVECEFCHVQGAFEKDDKKNKQTARQMMEMMFAINADHFDGERKVTCNTCHRGAAAPQPTPAVMSEMAMAEPRKPEEADPKENTAPAPDQLLDKYVQAVGGAAAVDKITSRVMKGTIDFGGRSLPIDIYSKDPEMRISFTHMSDGDNVTAFNGHEGWLAMPNGQQREMRGSDLDGASIDADLHLATHLKSMFSNMIPHGTEKVGDREAVVILGQRQGKPPIRLSFDKENGLLLRLVRYGETALGRMPTQIDYADYRDTNGVKVPYQWTLARPSGRFTIKVSDMKQNVPVDDAKFVRPPAPPEPQRAPAK